MHIDFFGPIFGKQLIIVDILSKWCEIVMFKAGLTPSTTIRALRKVFTRHGILYQIVLDNGSIFKCEEIFSFANQNSITWSFSAPGHPATKMMQTMKKQNQVYGSIQ